jgi:asparagine synthase (glutamine-hydrolysing)
MGICGRSTSTNHAPSAVDRTLAALAIGSARLHRHWSDPRTRLASCDDGVLASNSAGDAAAFDGRIDNCNDLKRVLSCDDLDRLDNAQVALLCYEKWGDEFCNRIIGDYACTIWDAEQRRMVIAVDPGGRRPLFYWLGPEEILFATEERGLWSDPKVPKALDEDRMAAWLGLLSCEPERSFFRDIFRVPPGRRVIWQRGSMRLERWWRPEHLSVLKLGSDRDYEEAVRHSLEEAVRCRIGGGEPVGATLSGGLDSSGVTAIAARLLAAQGRRLTAFTAAPAHPAPNERNRFVDEWPHAAALAAMYPNIDHVRISNDDAPLLDALELRQAGQQDFPVLNPFNTVWANGIDRAARDRRITIMLVGFMGNFTISYDGGELLASQLRKARLLGAARTIRDLRGFGGRSWLGLLGDIADAVLPATALRTLRRAVGKAEPGLFDYSILDPKFAREKDLETRAQAKRNIARGNSRALLLRVLFEIDASRSAASTRRLFGIDTRDPTADRRLVELCLSIPDNQFLRKGIYRSLIRRAMVGIVPDQILREQRRGLQAADWRFGFDAAIPKLARELDSLRASPLARRFLDLPRMQHLLDRWPGLNDSSEVTKDNYLHAFSRGLAAGRFIRWIEGANR